jgi:hypothetical protein
MRLSLEALETRENPAAFNPVVARFLANLGKPTALRTGTLG